jgi:hypothetical protein
MEGCLNSFQYLLVALPTSLLGIRIRWTSNQALMRLLLICYAEITSMALRAGDLAVIGLQKLRAY